MNRLTSRLTGVHATALLALYARALDDRSAHPILSDRWAQEIITRLDFDFAQFRTANKEHYEVGVRTRQMDEWTRDFITDHPDATVLDLGAGLDSQVFRIKPPSEGHWYDVDFPDVIELRNRLFPPHERHETIEADLTHGTWLEPLPRDRPVAVVADDVFMFLTEQELRQLLSRIVAHFPTGQIAFNAATAFQVKLANRHPAVKKAGAILQWSLDDPRALEIFDPTLKFAEGRMIIESPRLSHASWAYRATCAVMKSIPAFAGARRPHPPLHVLTPQRGVQAAVRQIFSSRNNAPLHITSAAASRKTPMPESHTPPHGKHLATCKTST